MKKKQWKCEKCGAVCKTRPRLQQIEMPAGDDDGRPVSGRTVLGRRTDMVIEFGVRICPKCQEVVLESIGLPLDEDALLIREAFDLDDEVPLETVAAWLRANNVGPKDLEEFARLRKSGSALEKLVEWFTKRGMAPEIVAPQGTDVNALAALREMGAKVKEALPQG